ncbi:Uncharacterised protein [Burkholderia pseudomallei]|nr:Uncharacterised protein [Burkholderia pseudomallei]CAJ3856788.1 Uncharacterised protein [Burkholderia pseudomallei]CAJ4637098.1 Uncharacterised protein [Burkholderia pseudomallei]CAJ4699874.1 Uncharacterised protein [Burkholderia pseudomallei]CAJ5026031.1 Uncharacterised protein [Burkholderia pseudomallei]
MGSELRVAPNLWPQSDRDMKKNDLLHMIAESGYNVGFGAKLHFATLDIVEKAPGWINVLGFVIGVYALIFPALAAAWVSATLVIASALTLYVTFYNPEKQKYDDAGVKLTQAYHHLHHLYAEVKAQPDAADLSEFAERHKQIVSAASGTSMSKQIFLAHEYAHVKFFWQHQIGWVDEQLQFTFLRDKMPFSAWITLVLVAIVAIALVVRSEVVPIIASLGHCKP